MLCDVSKITFEAIGVTGRLTGPTLGLRVGDCEKSGCDSQFWGILTIH